MNTVPSWFNTSERTELLQSRAQHWIGTPFRPNSSEAGFQGGVSCQKLVTALYRESGWIDLPSPEVKMSHAKFARIGMGLVDGAVNGSGAFVAIDLAQEELQAGDLLGFQIGQVIHHLGIYLDAGTFVHAMDGIGVTYSSLQDGTYQSQLKAAWRPNPSVVAARVLR